MNRLGVAVPLTKQQENSSKTRGPVPFVSEEFLVCPAKKEG